LWLLSRRKSLRSAEDTKRRRCVHKYTHTTGVEAPPDCRRKPSGPSHRKGWNRASFGAGRKRDTATRCENGNLWRLHHPHFPTSHINYLQPRRRAPANHDARAITVNASAPNLPLRRLHYSNIPSCQQSPAIIPHPSSPLGLVASSILIHRGALFRLSAWEAPVAPAPPPSLIVVGYTQLPFQLFSLSTQLHQCSCFRQIPLIRASSFKPIPPFFQPVRSPALVLRYI
jgi:hypothetical protein